MLLYLRREMRWFTIQKQFDLNNSINAISFISLGELHSIALRNGWSNQRIQKIDSVSEYFAVTDINLQEIILLYAKIDAFSQGKIIGMPLNMSSRNMGKNDLWIAATAAHYELTLITTDKDFSHLSNNFISLEVVEI